MLKHILYERLRDIPSFVKTMCHDHSGIIVGGAALYLVGEKERVHDWDIIIPLQSWMGAVKVLPYRCYTNTFGGVKVCDNLFTADIWADDVARYFATMNPNYEPLAVNIVTQQVITASRRSPNGTP